jgi:hypothetical protein
MGGTSFRIFFPDGSSEGLRLLEKSNWTGHSIFCPRPVFAEAKSRAEFARTGIYVLLGPSGEGELPEVYIGEGDPIRPRLENHQREKDFWTTAIAFTSKDANLNKAHVQYLESRLVDLARAAKRCKLANGNAPQLPNLSEADIADTETFLAEMLLCFPVLGVTIFEKPAEKLTVESERLTLKVAGYTAYGYESAEGFVVLAGSDARGQDLAGITDFARQTRAALRENGALVSSGDRLKFTQNYEFESPSGAASVILGVSANGRTAWKTPEGRTLKQVQELSA